ncbi:MAG TPA: hypothetical protein VJ998_05700, partial [Pseudomonadales bacterium]|nr:hypothetical protein [Pseudomonadales bacterium]
ALIFAVHPQHVQSVAWLVERKDTLYVLFTLLCFISYIRVHRSGAAGARRFVPLLFLALALMSKPMAVTVPAVLIMFDIYPLRRWQRGLGGIVALIIEKWPYWLITAGVIVITLYTQQRAMASLSNLPLWARPATALNNYLFYVSRFLVPLNLSPIYPYSSDATTISAISYWLPGTTFLTVTLGGGAWLFVRHIRWPLLMVLFYVITLLPVCGLVAVGPSKALDYYSYLATLPFAMLVALGMVKLYAVAGQGRTVVLGVSAFYLFALAALSFQQVRVWRNELTVWVRANELYPESGYINRNLSSTYFSIGEYDEALKYAKLSARESPMNAEYLKELQAAIRQQQDK